MRLVCMLKHQLSRSVNKRRLLQRLGRATAVWIVGTALTVTAGGLVAPYAMKSDSDSSATNASKNVGEPSVNTSDVEWVTVEHNGAASVSKPTVTIPELPYRSEVVASPEPAGGSSDPSEYSPEAYADDASQTVADMKENDIEETAESSLQTSAPIARTVDRSRVELFYATDRSQIIPWSIEYWYPVLLPTALALVGLAFDHRCVCSISTTHHLGLGIAASLTLFGMASTKVVVRYQQAIKIESIGGVVFGGKRNMSDNANPVHYGRALVTLPPNHQKGKVERPNALLFEYSESPDKHVMLRQMDPLQENEFFYAVDESVQQAAKPSMLLFIHGYNVTFDDALLRTAQLSADLEFDGVPLLYSWPSTGLVSGYLTDEENVEWSVAHLEKLLVDLKHRTKVESIHVIVHSMGNRALLGAVERMTLRYPSEQPMLDQVVLAAPDVDVGQFDSRYRDAIGQQPNKLPCILRLATRRYLLRWLFIKANGSACQPLACEPTLAL